MKYCSSFFFFSFRLFHFHISCVYLRRIKHSFFQVYQFRIGAKPILKLHVPIYGRFFFLSPILKPNFAHLNGIDCQTSRSIIMTVVLFVNYAVSKATLDICLGARDWYKKSVNCGIGSESENKMLEKHFYFPQTSVYRFRVIKRANPFPSVSEARSSLKLCPSAGCGLETTTCKTFPTCPDQEFHMHSLSLRAPLRLQDKRQCC